MPALLVLRFPPLSPEEYEAVNGKLEIDVEAGGGKWPAEIRSHAAGTAEDGTFVVAEVWDSRAAQQRFMDTRLGPALAAAGIPAPTSVTWVDETLGYQAL